MYSGNYRWLRGAVFGPAIAVCCGACQTYAPTPLTPALTDNDARVSLLQRSSGTSYGPLGNNIHELEGNVRDVNDSSLTLVVHSIRRWTGSEESRDGERVVIPRSDIEGVDRGVSSARRSLLAAAAVIGGAFFLTTQVRGGDASGASGTPTVGTAK